MGLRWSDIRYVVYRLVTAPLIPYMIYTGLNVRRRVPKLPEALYPEGISIADSSSSEYRIVYLGESTMAGVGVQEHRVGLAGVLSSMISEGLKRNVIWQVVAKNGYTIAQTIHQSLPCITWHEIDMIIIATGANDAFRLSPTWSWRKHIYQIVNKIQSKYGDIPIVFCNLPPVGIFPALPRWLRMILNYEVKLLRQELIFIQSHKHNVWFNSDDLILISNQNLSKDSIEKLFSDGIHPSEATYQKWAEMMYNYMTYNKVL